jgi:serine-type D-Ala-D-Ala carboxypeptidase/endopeptidase (penicillin-binding protein 4)
VRNPLGFPLFLAGPMRSLLRSGAIAAAALALLATPAAQARGEAPDEAAATPIAHASAKARKAVSAPQLRAGLAKLFRRVGKSGALVVDAASRATLFARRPGRPRILASNTKIFTTAAALGRFRPEGRLETSAWSVDDVADGISQGLYLRGGGDPTLSTAGLAKLADRVRAAGVVSVQGPLRYDDTFLDRIATVPQHGITSEGVGTLSGLTLDGGSPSDPAKVAAQRFDDELRKSGVSIGTSVTPGLVVPGFVRLADYDSPTMADIVQDTNVPSNNFLAEMLLKDVGAQFGDSGSTAGGIDIVRQFAAQQGAGFTGENGSGLSRLDKASPTSVVRVLTSMLGVDRNTPPEAQAEQTELRDAWVNSLAVAGSSGTLARRMRGTAAARRCHAKTGTLTGVSALSGYCFRGGNDADHGVIFSLLMNNVDVNRAHLVQDRMAALIARYSR